MRQVVSKPRMVQGSITLPGDKSISHRALILNSIANGTAVVSGLATGEDVLSTIRCLRALGVEITEGREVGTVTVGGSGGSFQEPNDVLDAGNSGTCLRLLAGAVAGQPFLSVLTGDSSLRSRPMGRIVQPLTLMGAQVHGRLKDTCAPLAIKGGDLRGIEYTMPVASAQVKSCLLLAGLFASSETVLHQPAQSRDHTERMMRAMGADVTEDGCSLAFRPSQLKAVDVAVPGDISSAAFWIVAALCHPSAEVNITGVGINSTRSGILEALQAMGADIALDNPRHQGGEPVADIRVRSSHLHSIEVGGDLMPRIIDEVPLLAVAACFASGTTTVRDAQELRVKESDRVATTVGELSRLGANIEELADGMVIHGTGRLQGDLCHSHGDHRLAMALAVAGLLADGETTVEGAEAAAVSYPSFWEQLKALDQDFQG